MLSSSTPTALTTPCWRYALQYTKVSFQQRQHMPISQTYITTFSPVACFFIPLLHCIYWTNNLSGAQNRSLTCCFAAPTLFNQILQVVSLSKEPAEPQTFHSDCFLPHLHAEPTKHWWTISIFHFARGRKSALPWLVDLVERTGSTKGMHNITLPIAKLICYSEIGSSKRMASQAQWEGAGSLSAPCFRESSSQLSPSPRN